MIRKPLLLLAAGAFLMPGLLSQSLPGDLPPRPKPTLRWKYGWRDGKIANTIGSARHGDPLPTLSMEATTGYSPLDLWKAYGFDRITNGGDGTGETIAIIIPFASSTNHLQADLDHFSSYYRLPSTTLRFFTPDGTGTPYKDTTGWYSEAALDVEWAHAIAPGASIAVIISPDDYSLVTNSLFDCATGTNAGQAGAGVVSMSWALPEDRYSMDDWSGIFTNTNATYVAASGDNGTADGAMGVEWPAAHTNVVSIGGTSLIYDPDRQLVVSETAWTNGGGGISSREAMPPWQRAYLSSWQTNLLSRAGDFRCVPDFSCDGDPYTGVSVWMTDPKTGTGGWTAMGGTSASTPMAAALIARMRSLGIRDGTGLNARLYGITSDRLFWDITSGSNGGYQAGEGYDPVTGLGAPIADAIANVSPTNSLLRPQGITFGKIPSRCVYGGASFRIPATSDSGLPLIFSSAAPDILTVTPDGMATPVNAGVVPVIAQQPGDGSSWEAATPATRLVTVAKAPQNLSRFPAMPNRHFTRTPIPITTLPGASSGLPVVLRVASGHASLTNAGGTNSILLTGLGKVVLTASQPGYDPIRAGSPTNYLAATPVSVSFKVVK